jgi:Domain of unknown function (DUF4276)
VIAEHIEFLVEEPSMEAALRLLVPRVIGDTSFEVYSFQCKQNLLSNLPSRLRGYASWLPDNYRVVVVVDRDDDDCGQLKASMERFADEAGLITRSQSQGPIYQVVNRVAIEELEAWFFGDWRAVCQAYPKVSRNVPQKQGFRDPDSINGGTWEALERHLQRAGYFKTGLRKVEAARTITQYMQPNQNRSRSFQVFHDALAEMTS